MSNIDTSSSPSLQTQKERSTHPLNMMASLRDRRMKPDVIAYSIMPRVRTRVVFIDKDQSDDYEINDCIVCGKSQGVGALTQESLERLDEKAKPCFVAFKLVVASSEKRRDLPPQLAMTTQVVCEQCCIEHDYKNKQVATTTTTTKECAPESQCTMLSLMEFHALLNTQLLESTAQDLLADLMRFNKSQWTKMIQDWFLKTLYPLDFYRLLWRVRHESAAPEKKQCSGCGDTQKPLIGQCQCHARFWCSETCQRNDWFTAKHEQWCLSQVWLPIQFIAVVV